MNSLLILVPISLVLLGIAVGAFWWAVRQGQFDDLDTPPLDMLRDSDRPAPRPRATQGNADGNGSGNGTGDRKDAA